MKVLDIILEAEGSKIYTIGDSHAEGLANYGGPGWVSKAMRGQPAAGRGQPGKHLSAMDDIPKGSRVVICVGANDSANNSRILTAPEFEGKRGSAKSPEQVAEDCVYLVTAAKQKGLKPVFVLFPNGDQPDAPHKAGSPRYYTGKFTIAVRDAIKSKLDVPVYDLNGSSLYDGVHADASGYKKVCKEVESAAPTASKPKLEQGAQAANTTSTGKLEVPSSLWHGEGTKDIQQALIDLGYKLPKHGADSYFGPETAQAVRQFQKDNGLKVDGDPGPETVGKLNELIGKKAPAAKSEVPAPATPASPATRGITSKAAPATPQQGAMAAPGPAKTKSGTNIVDKSAISAYLKSKRMSGNHRIGILANIAGESSFNSAVINPNDKGKRSIGLFQHRAERADNLEKAVPDWRTNWQGQIDFALSEPAGRRYLATKFQTYEQAVEQWVRDFERPENTWGAVTDRITVADNLVKNKV